MKKFVSIFLASVALMMGGAGVSCAGGGTPAGYAQRTTRMEGTVFHTTYHITYEGQTSYRDEIEALFAEFDGSLSMFNDTSILTRMNQNDPTVVANAYVRKVLTKADEVSRATDGAFDITVAPLVNLYGFGFKHSDRVTAAAADSLLAFVGYQSISLDEAGHLHKQDPRTQLDASSIAKGYMCDVLADFLREKEVHNFMVEIGGEIALQGTNPHGKPWGVGINVPAEDSLQTNRALQNVLHLTHGAIATSGNYRNFYYKNGRRFAHTINPRTGKPAESDILSSTVIADDCITADAYATAFMVLGSARALDILAADTTLMAYFILPAADSTDYHVIYSPALRAALAHE